MGITDVRTTEKQQLTLKIRDNRVIDLNISR